MDIAIINGKVVCPQGIIEASIGIDGEKIVNLSRSPSLKADKIIDAKGKIVFPGIIDPHVHFDLKTARGLTADDFISGTSLCAYGGITTFIDFVHPDEGQSLEDAVNKQLSKAAQQSLVDYSFHLHINRTPPSILQSLTKYRQEKLTNSIKIYTTYGKLKIEDASISDLLEKTDYLLTVHAENDSIVTTRTQEHIEKGLTEVKYHPDARPSIAEIETVSRVIEFAHYYNKPIYLHHLSTKRSLELLALHKGTLPPVFGETTPHYLYFTRKQLEGEKGMLFTMTPALRSQEDCDALWQGIKNGTISTLGTDHCSFTATQKGYKSKKGVAFTDVPMGVMGVEELFPAIFTGAQKYDIPLVTLAATLATNAAKIFDLYPQKGAIELGADADILIFDPKIEQKVTPETCHSKAGYSIYDGFTFKGWPSTTISRGTILLEESSLVTKDYGRGHLVRTHN